MLVHRSPGGTGLASEDEPQKAREKTAPGRKGKENKGPRGAGGGQAGLGCARWMGARLLSVLHRPIGKV